MALIKKQDVTRLVLTRQPDSDTAIFVEIYYTDRVTDDNTGQVFDAPPTVLNSAGYAALPANQRAQIKARLLQMVAELDRKIPPAN